jgi:phosphoribosylformylglycinamidine cyclo-ligase
MGKKGLTYKDAGVDIETGDDISREISGLARRTFGPEVIENSGGFAGLFSLGGPSLFAKKMRDPVLVSCSDGVGTKLALAEVLEKHDTVGIDLVAMSVNDLACTGATPLFFLDYVAASKLSGAKLLEVMRGIVEGCRDAGCALLGGETAEMPGFYQGEHYDLVGFAVGVGDRPKMLTRDAAAPDDVVIGIGSSGLHSNGYSLARAVVKKAKVALDHEMEELGTTVGETLLEPTLIYAGLIRSVLAQYQVKKVVKGIAHITGGGLPGNIVRVVPRSCGIRLYSRRWKRSPIFGLLKEWGSIEEAEMYRVFNMGIGLVIISAPYYADAMTKRIRKLGFKAWKIGEVVEGDHEVVIK